MSFSFQVKTKVFQHLKFQNLLYVFFSQRQLIIMSNHRQKKTILSGFRIAHLDVLDAGLKYSLWDLWSVVDYGRGRKQTTGRRARTPSTEASIVILSLLDFINVHLCFQRFLVMLFSTLKYFKTSITHQIHAYISNCKLNNTCWHTRKCTQYKLVRLYLIQMI